MAEKRHTLIRALGLFSSLGLVLGLALGLTLGADPAWAGDLKPKLEVVKSAEVTNVSCEVKPYKGKDRLHVTVEIKNVSSELKRYRVNIWLPEGVSGGGFYPRKGKGVEAGKTLARTFPMYYDKIPAEMEIIVKELPTGD